MTEKTISGNHIQIFFDNSHMHCYAYNSKETYWYFPSKHTAIHTQLLKLVKDDNVLTVLSELKSDSSQHGSTVMVPTLLSQFEISQQQYNNLLHNMTTIDELQTKNESIVGTWPHK
jgi:hypothetical protein